MKHIDMKRYLNKIIDQEIDHLPEEPTADDFEKLRTLSRLKKMLMEGDDLEELFDPGL